jgi:hypothetical protein
MKKPQPVLQLREKINTNMLMKLISAEGLPEEYRIPLKRYYKRVEDNSVPVKYYWADGKDEGRLFAEGALSLQSFPKRIRHALANNFYYDIDMENCHPKLILQYCQKNNIPCPAINEYVTTRDQVLWNIQEFHKINYACAKKLILRLCYLGKYAICTDDDDKDGVVPDQKDEFVEKFALEMKEIAKQVCIIEATTYEKIKADKDKKNKKASTLSIVLNCLEHACLMAIKKYLEKNGFIIGTLCFDGLLVEKKRFKHEDHLHEVLMECENAIKDETQYEMKLVEKPMDLTLPFDLPKYSSFVTCDLDCMEKIFLIEGKNKFKFCEGDLYIYDDRTGIYNTREETLFHYLIKNREYLDIIISTNDKGDQKLGNYAESTSLMKNIPTMARTLCQDDNWLHRTQNSSLGYLLFKNGIYNMKDGTFNYEFNPNIVFHHQIPHEYRPQNNKEMKDALNLSFGVLFDNYKPMIYALSRALAGDTELKKFYFCPGKTDAGKSCFVDMLKIAFGGYIGNFNATELAYTPATDSRDPAQKLRWALRNRFCRILTSNEANMKKEMDGNAIKMQSAGRDELTGRNHHGHETHFRPHYTIFCMLNDIPTINPYDSAVDRRTEYIEFPHVFVNENKVGEKDYYREMNPTLDETINSEEFIMGFIHIFLRAYKDCLKKNRIPQFDSSVKERWTKDAKQKDEIINFIKEHYQITHNEKDKTAIAELRRFREVNKKVFSTISNNRFNEILEDDLELKEGRSAESRFWQGIVRKPI